MKPFQANLINAIILIAFGAWAYLSNAAEDRSLTALIPAAFGVIFLLLTPALKKEGKVVAHVVVLLTLLIIGALIMPMKGALGREDTLAVIRVGIMWLSSVFAMVVFIRSFIAVRRARQLEGE